MTRYYIIRPWEERTGDGNWAHLYPERNGEKPASYTFEEAEIKRQRFTKLADMPFRIIPESDFDKYEVPKRW